MTTAGTTNGAESGRVSPASSPLTPSPLTPFARTWWAISLRGVSSLCFGLVALLRPVPTLLSLTTLFAAYMLIDGTLAIHCAVRAGDRRERRGGLVAEGVINLVAAALVLALPGTAVLTFGYIAAVWVTLSGAILLAASKRLVFGQAMTALAAGISILFGLLLVIAPLGGIDGLADWLGAYALLFGTALISLGRELRWAMRDAANDAEQTTASRLT